MIDKINDFLANILSIISNFYNPKLGKWKFVFRVILTLLIVIVGFGLWSSNHSKKTAVKQYQQNSKFSSSGKLSNSNRKKEYNDAIKQANTAFAKYGKNSKEYGTAQQKVFQIQSADQQVTTPSNPGKDIQTSLKEVIADYGKVSNDKLNTEYRNKIYLSSGELQWMYENVFMKDMNIDGKLGFDIYSGDMYVGISFTNKALQKKFETIATIMYKNSDVAPRTNGISFHYINSSGQFNN